MITPRLVGMLAFRIHLTTVSLCTVCDWDREKKRMKPSKPFYFWNWGLLIGSVTVNAINAVHRIYSNGKILFGNHVPEPGEFETPSSYRDFLTVTMIYFSIDVLAGTFVVNILGVAIMLSQRRQTFWRLVNAVLDLDQWMMQTLKSHNGYEPDGRYTGRKAEFILGMLNVGSVALPIFYGIFLLHKYEPVHRTLEDWFEIEPQLNLGFLPLMALVDWGIFFCANVVYIPASMLLVYMFQCKFWIPGITPRSTVIHQGKIKYNTDLGLIDEAHAMKLYRCQQILNVAVNDLMKSGWVGLHHATILTVFVLATFMCIKYTDNVVAMGNAGIILPAVSFAAMLIEYHETHLIGKILWESREFLRIGKKTSRGSSGMRRFFASCSAIKIHTAYPYFVVSFDTFLLILHQGIDFLVQMLVL